MSAVREAVGHHCAGHASKWSGFRPLLPSIRLERRCGLSRPFRPRCRCQALPNHSRRDLVLSSTGVALATMLLCWSRPASALGFKKELKKRKIPLEEYDSQGDGSKVYDLTVGNGAEAKAGSKVKVHFDCLYKGLDVASSRAARLLGGNRTVSEPLEFVAGNSLFASDTKEDVGERAGGLYAGASGPKPPPVLGSAVVGMRKGGKRSVIVPPELGYGDRGLLEIPPNSTFELQVELLTVG